MGGADLRLDGSTLSLEDVAKVARCPFPVTVDAAAVRRMERTARWVQSAAASELRDADGQPLTVYGVNTGYGSLARVRIPAEHIERLSLNLIRSHAAGVGPPLPLDAVRAMMLLRANALAKGASGCRPALVEALCAMLSRDVVPEVPSRGSCGSSGDLAPLAHLGLVLFRGETDRPEQSGFAWYQGQRLTGAEAMRRAGIERLIPAPKEGLAITNGAQLSAGLAALAGHDAASLVHLAELAAAMSFEALQGVSRALHPGVQRLRPYPGAIAVARDLLGLLEGSNLVDALEDKVQDAYSLRCTPQVLGAVRDGVRFARQQVRIELNSATDNPVFLLDADGPNKAFSAGLFHGEPVGMAADHLHLAICQLGALSERRTYRLTTGSLSGRLPPLLLRRDKPGMGLMVPQTVAAALVSDTRSRAWPASADSIPTCEDQEDYVAMSTTAARRAAAAVDNARHVVAIELLSAAHGLWWRLRERPGTRLGTGTGAALAWIEERLGRGGGSCPSEDVAKLAGAADPLLEAVQRAVGPLEAVDDA